VARHRSPKGRRAHLGPPLSAMAAAAGVGGGAHRSVSASRLTPSLAFRFIATALSGGALAATAHHALAEALPRAADELSNSVDEVLGTRVAASTVLETVSSAAVPAVDVVAPEPVVADAAALVKAADLHRAAAEVTAAEPARAVEEARTAEKLAKSAPAAAEQVKEAVAPVGRAVQMITGRVTSGFGGRWGSVHQGLDIAAPIGTPIRVPLDGTVIDSGPARGFGLWVRVRHDDGTITVYGHINRSLVKVGEKVAAGEEIAEVGNRGQSTGPHLHIEVITPGGKKINPRPWLDEYGIGY
jgi:murein DD-endopeptidase MepM/ murein hydrolase activator NlpD